MKLPYLSKQVALTVEVEDSSLAALLEQGLQCVRQGLYAEGTAFFVSARNRGLGHRDTLRQCTIYTRSLRGPLCGLIYF
ncbi:MAG TPA: hypothetical protein VGL94_11440 [Ktedonobacteraceae bacterium]|jgi:hypothetical protein